jgi:predicted Fe-S protein YdhL (DUF1289 family)
MESPCINICTMRDNVCTGCNRTLEQIKNWTRYTDVERTEIMKQLKEKSLQ